MPQPCTARATITYVAAFGGAEGKAGVGPEKVEGPAIMAKNVGKDNWTRSVFTHLAEAASPVEIELREDPCGSSVIR